MSSSSAVFRARVECVLQAVMAHTATEMIRLFEEALRTTVQSKQRRSSKLETERILSESAESAHTTAAENILSAHTAPPTATESILSESAHTTPAENILSESAESAHTTTTTTAAATETASDRRAVGAEVLPAVQQVLSGEEALSLFRPVKDDDSTVTERPGPSQARDVNLSVPLMHTAVAVGGQVKTLRTLRPRTAALYTSGAIRGSLRPRTAVKGGGVTVTAPPSSHSAAVRDVDCREHAGAAQSTSLSEGSQTVSQFSVAAVKTEEDAMDDDFEGHDDSVSVEPKHRYNTEEELVEDEGPKKRRKKGSKNRGTKCRMCKKSYYFGVANHQKVCKKVCTCSYCGETFNNWQSMTRHERKHSGTRYSCTFCDKTFIYNTGRIAHEHSQHSNTKYRCSDCGKMFEKHLERDQHECIVFTGSFAFSCTECNKGFKRQYILKKHQLAEHPGIFSNKQKVQVEASEVEVKIEEDYEQDMYGQDIVIDQHSETDMGLTNQHSAQDMGLTNQVNEQDMGLKREVHEQDMGLKHQDYGQDIGLNNQVNEQGMGLNIQVNEQDMGLNIQVNEQDMGLMCQGYEIDIMGHDSGYEQYMGFMNLPESGHFNLE